MKKKISIAIVSLVLVFSVLAGATYAWFNLSTEVSAGTMNMTVQTAGSLYIRSRDYAVSAASDGRNYGTKIQFSENLLEDPDSKGVQPTASLYRFLKSVGGTMLEASASKSAYETTLPGVATGLSFNFDAGNATNGGKTLLNASEEGNAWGAIPSDVSPGGAPITFNKSDKILRAINTKTPTSFVYAQENADYGKWNVDLLSAAVDQQVFLNATLSFSQIERYTGAISAADVARDYLSSYRIEIYEIIESIVGEQVVLSESYYPVATLSISGTSIDIITDLVTGGTASSTNIKDEVLDFEVDYLEKTNLGTFGKDEPRFFEIYFYVDGTQDNGKLPFTNTTNGVTSTLTTGNQNHFSKVASKVNLEFAIVD